VRKNKNMQTQEIINYLAQNKKKERQLIIGDHLILNLTITDDPKHHEKQQKSS
jgi:hypothetical protein